MKVLIAGDYVPSNRIENKVENADFSFFDEIRPITAKADYSIVNLECPLVLRASKPIVKTGPNLKCGTNNLLLSIKYAGFDCVTLANNHFRDFGQIGVEDTINSCKSFGIDYVGGGINIQEADRVLYKQFGNEMLAIINVCESEWSIATNENGGSNPINPIKQYYSIIEAKQKADFVIVITHGGIEYFNLPTSRMVELYRFYINAGADAVFNHHQHCYSGYEVYKGKPIFYGVGNFCFDMSLYSNDFWNKGYLVCLDFKKEITFEIIPYNQNSTNPIVKLLLNEESDCFSKKLNDLNLKIQDIDRRNKEVQAFFSKNSRSTLSFFEPYSGRILSKLYSLNLLPSLISKKVAMKVKNMISCESLREKAIYILNEIINK